MVFNYIVVFLLYRTHSFKCTVAVVSVHIFRDEAYDSCLMKLVETDYTFQTLLFLSFSFIYLCILARKAEAIPFIVFSFGNCTGTWNATRRWW